MTLYSSKTPRDLNHDPEPWARMEPYRTHLDSRWSASGPGRVLDPRPEYDHVQHNPPNPILVDFRNWMPEDLPRVQDRARFWIPALRGGAEARGWAGFNYPHTAEHAVHARRVLERLANLADKESRK